MKEIFQKVLQSVTRKLVDAENLIELMVISYPWPRVIYI